MIETVVMLAGMALLRWGRDWSKYGLPILAVGWLWLMFRIVREDGWAHAGLLIAFGVGAVFLVELIGRAWRRWRGDRVLVAELVSVTCQCGEQFHTPHEFRDHQRVMHPDTLH